MSSKLKVNNIIPSTGTQIGISTTGGGINLLTGTVVTGIITASGFDGPITQTGDFTIDDWIVHAGDTNTKFGFPAADTFTVETAGSERLRIKSDGDIRAGDENNTWAGDRLEVAGTKEGVLGLAHYGSTASEAATINFYRSISGTIGNDTVPTDAVGEIRFRGWSGNAYQMCAKILASTDGTWNSSGDNTDTPGKLTFHTAPDGSSTVEERLCIDSSGNIGQGSATPTTPNGSNADNPNNGLVFTMYGDSPAINLVHNVAGGSSASDDYAAINFGRTGSSSNPYRAIIGYKQSDDLLRINAKNSIVFDTGGDINTNERLRIDSDGDLWHGLTPVTHHNNRHAFFHNASDNYVSITSGSGATAGIVFGDSAANTTANYESYIAHYNVNNSLYLYTGQGTKGLELKSGGDASIIDGNLKVANGHGIDFSDTGGGSGTSNESEILTDYEHGEWTPVLQHYIGGGFTAPTYSTAGTVVGRYTKIGNMVHISASFLGFNISNAHGSSFGRITGLPFTSTNHPNHRDVISAMSDAFTTGGVNFSTYWNQTNLNSMKHGTSVFDWAILSGGSTKNLVISGHYTAS